MRTLLEQRLSEYTLQKFGDSECPSLFRSDYKKPATAPSKNKPATAPEKVTEPVAGGSPEKPKGTGDRKSGGKKRSKPESTGLDSPKKQKKGDDKSKTQKKSKKKSDSESS